MEMMMTTTTTTMATAMTMTMSTTESLNQTELEATIIHEEEILCYQNQSSPSTRSGLFCPRIWDSWVCWEETPAGTNAYAPCPHFVTGFDPNRMAYKECLDDGSWFRHPISNRTWSNYTTCVDQQDLARRQAVNTIYEVGYTLSLCALIISLVIFCSFRCLECTRVRIHKHLFVSFIINNTLWLIWYRAVINNPDILSNPANQIWCITLHVLVQYFMVANYFWMFCEGLYLHTLLVFAFTRAESKLLKGFYIFGWLGPAVPTALYTGFRISANTQDDVCWLNESQWRIFLIVPVFVCLALSLAFLINILRVLLTKLNDTRRTQQHASAYTRRDSNSSDSQNALRKAARATLILIPLLGLHYFLTPFKPEPGSDGEMVYECIAAVSSSLQGLCVSLLFCFCNGEVISVLRRRFCRRYCQGDGSYTRGDYSCAPTSMTTMVIRRQSEIGKAAEVNL